MLSISRHSKPILLSLMAAFAASAIAIPCLSNPNLGSNVYCDQSNSMVQDNAKQNALTNDPQRTQDSSWPNGVNEGSKPSGGSSGSSDTPYSPVQTLAQYNTQNQLQGGSTSAPHWEHPSWGGLTTTTASGLKTPYDNIAFGGPSTGGGGELAPGTAGLTSMVIPGVHEGGMIFQAFNAMVDKVMKAMIQDSYKATGLGEGQAATALGGAAGITEATLNGQATQRKAQDTPGAGAGQAKTNQNAQKEQGADNLAAMERYHAAAAIEFVRSFVPNFTTEGGNKWNKIRNQLFLPMALLLLLPGAILCQLKSTVSQGFSVLGEISPFEGIFRSIIAIFLIPATYLIVNYSIDTANSITVSIAQEYRKIFGTSMYADAFCGHIRAFPIRLPEENFGMIVNIETKMFNYFGNSPLARLEGRTLAIKYEDPCAGIYIVPEDRSDEIVPFLVNEERMAFNQVNAAFTCAWTILCAAQEAYLYYLWFVGPIMAALWVYPSKQLRDAFPSWIEGVVSVCMWSLFWNTTILLMACFRGVDDTGTIMFTALNFLAIGSVKFAFDFSGLVKDAGTQAVRVGEKAAAAAAAAQKKAAEGGGKDGGGKEGGGDKKDGGKDGGTKPPVAPSEPVTVQAPARSTELTNSSAVPTGTPPLSASSSSSSDSGGIFGSSGNPLTASSHAPHNSHPTNHLNHLGAIGLGLVAGGLAGIPLTAGIAALGGLGGSGGTGLDGADANVPLPQTDNDLIAAADQVTLNGVGEGVGMSTLAAQQAHANAHGSPAAMLHAQNQSTQAMMARMQEARQHAMAHPGGESDRRTLAAQQHQQLADSLRANQTAFNATHNPAGASAAQQAAQQAKMDATMSGLGAQMRGENFLSRESLNAIRDSGDTHHNYNVVSGGIDSISSVSAAIAPPTNQAPFTSPEQYAAASLNASGQPSSLSPIVPPPSYDQNNNSYALNSATPGNYSGMTGLTGNTDTTTQIVGGNPTDAALRNIANEIGSAPTVIGATGTSIGDPNLRMTPEQYASASPGVSAGYSSMNAPADQNSIAPANMPGMGSFGGDQGFARNSNIVGDQIAQNYQQFNNDVANVGAQQAANQVLGAVESNRSQAESSLANNLTGTAQVPTTNTDYASTGGGNAIQQPGQTQQQYSNDAFARNSNDSQGQPDNSMARQQLTELANNIGSAPTVIGGSGSSSNQTSGSSTGSGGSSGEQYFASSSPSSTGGSYSAMPSSADQSSGTVPSSQSSGGFFGSDNTTSGGNQTFADNSNIVGNQIANNYQQFDQDVANVGAQQAAEQVRTSYGGTEYVANESLGERVGGTPQALTTNSEVVASASDNSSSSAFQQPGLPQQSDANSSFARASNDSQTNPDNAMARQQLTDLANNIGSAPAVLGGAVAGAQNANLARNLPGADGIRQLGSDALQTGRPQAASPPPVLPPMMVPQGEARQYIIDKLGKSSRPPIAGPGVAVPGRTASSKPTRGSTPVRPQASNTGRPMPTTPPVSAGSATGKQTPTINDWTSHLASETLKRKARKVLKKDAAENQADMEALKNMQKPDEGGWTI